jgi:hypothetical protein
VIGGFVGDIIVIGIENGPNVKKKKKRFGVLPH